MKRTPPPSFPVEKQKEALRVHKAKSKLKQHVLSVSEGSFPHEAFPYGITMPQGGDLAIDAEVFFFWRPNNYRLKIPIKKTSIGNEGIPSSTTIKFPVEFSTGRTGKGVQTFKLNDNITLQVGPKAVMAIWSLRKGNKKLWFKVNCASTQEMDAWIDNKVQDIHALLIEAAQRFNLPLDYDKAIWIKHEDSIKGEEFIDSLPEELYLNDTYVKKVYARELEAKAPAYVKNYFANRMLDRAAPEILEVLNAILERLPIPSKPVTSHPAVEFLVKEGFDRKHCNKFFNISGLNEIQAPQVTPLIFPGGSSPIDKYDLCQACGCARFICHCLNSQYITQEVAWERFLSRIGGKS